MLRQEARAIRLDFMPKERTMDTITVDEAVEALRKTVEVRNNMGGAMYYNIMNEQVHVWYDVCRHVGVSDEIMTELYELLQ